MISEIYNWIESRSGVSYDFNQELYDIQGDTMIVSPYEFKFGYEVIILELHECVDIIDEYKDEIPDDLPEYDDLKLQFVATVLNGITNIINHVCDRLSIKRLDISTMNSLDMTVGSLCLLCEFLNENTNESIIKNHLFEKFDSDNDNIFTQTFEIVNSDITNMTFAVDTIKEEYFNDRQYEI